MMSCTRSSLSLRQAATVAVAVGAPQCRGSTACCFLLRRFASAAPVVRPSHVSPAERAALRAARKERASKVLEQQQQQQQTLQQPTTTMSSTSSSSSPGAATAHTAMSRYIWYLSVGVPSLLLAWGFSDENSPPAQFCRAVGLTGYIRSYTDEIAKPAHTKLLPDWAHVR